MKFLNFVKDHIMTILAFIMLAVLLVWSGFIIAAREDASAETTLSGPLEENNEPSTTSAIPEVVTGPYRYFDIPLDEELQDYIWELCDEYHVSRTLVYAIIQRESQFDPNTIGDNGASYGLMQVQPLWHEDRMELLNCNDLFDPYQNVRVGIDYLAELVKTGKSISWVLMAYNGGRSYADEMQEAGQVSQYAKDVIKYKDEFRSVRDE